MEECFRYTESRLSQLSRQPCSFTLHEVIWFRITSRIKLNITWLCLLCALGNVVRPEWKATRSKPQELIKFLIWNWMLNQLYKVIWLNVTQEQLGYNETFQTLKIMLIGCGGAGTECFCCQKQRGAGRTEAPDFTPEWNDASIKRRAS